MSNLIIYNGASYSPPSSLTASQDWDYSLISPLRKSYIYTQASPSAEVLDITIKDFVTLDTSGTYEGYVLRATVQQTQGNPSTVFWLNVLEIPIQGELTRTLTPSNRDLSLNIAIVNENVLLEGIYAGQILLNVYGVIGTTETFIERQTFSIELRVLEELGLDLFPDELSITAAVGAPLPPPINTRVLSTLPFTIRSNEFIEITGDNIVLDSTANNFSQWSGVGSQDIQIGLTPEVFNQVSAGDTRVSFVLLNGHRDGYASMNINMLPSAAVVVTPNALDYTAIIGVLEASAQDLEIFSVYPVTINFPSWITMVQQAGNSNKYTVRVTASTNLAAGTYTGNITIIANTVATQVPVRYRVLGPVDYNLNTNFNWCRDDKAFMQLSALDDARATVELRAQIRNTDSLLLSDKRFTHQLPFFRNTAQLHVGDYIKRLLHKSNNIDPFGIVTAISRKRELTIAYNNHAIVDIEVSGLSGDIPTVSNAIYIDGRPPVDNDNAAVKLDYNSVTQRVTARSMAIINYATRTPLILRRTVDLSTSLPVVVSTGNVVVYGRVLGFEGLITGSICEVYAEAIGAGGTLFKQRYIVYPEGQESTHVIWLNEHNTFSAYEFTGNVKVSTDYERQDFTNYRALAESTQTLDLDKIINFSINTGFIPHDNQVIIDSILSSKQVFVLFEGKKTAIAVRPSTDVLENFDSLKQLYDFEIKFTVNDKDESTGYA